MIHFFDVPLLRNTKRKKWHFPHASMESMVAGAKRSRVRSALTIPVQDLRKMALDSGDMIFLS